MPNDGKLSFIKPLSPVPFPVRQIDWRALVYFCKAKQPVEENKLTFLVIFLLRTTPLKCFSNQTLTYSRRLAGKAGEGRQRFGAVNVIFVPYPLLSLSRISPIVQCCKSPHSGSLKPSGGNDRTLLSLLPCGVCPQGQSTVYATLVAWPHDTILRFASPFPLGGKSSVFNNSIHLPLPSLSAFVQVFLSSLQRREPSVTSYSLLFHFSLLTSVAGRVLLYSEIPSDFVCSWGRSIPSNRGT